VAGVTIALVTRRAGANGAFPNSDSVHSPPDRMQEIVLATNFGLILSEDSGATWAWSCEQPASTNGFFYQIGAGPRHRFFGLASSTVIYSDDGSCGWSVARGALSETIAVDFFPDPTNADRVLALGLRFGDAGAVYVVFQSTDGGATFDTVLYTADVGDVVTGVESAQSDAKTLYLTLSKGTAQLPTLARSADGGTTWVLNDLSSSIGKGKPWLMGVDPSDANKVFIRFIQPDNAEAVVVTEDGGVTATKGVVIPEGAIASFVRMTTGTVLVGALNSSSDPILLRSKDGGRTFDTLAMQPHLRGLSERAGIVYAAADNFADGFAVGRSTDEGSSWQRVLSYDGVTEVLSCVSNFCRDGCEMLARGGIFNSSTCDGAGDGGRASPEASDGKAPPRDASEGETTDIPTNTISNSGGKGCQCGLACSSGDFSRAKWAVVGIAWMLHRRRARKRRKTLGDVP
jgi:hypothetical protein